MSNVTDCDPGQTDLCIKDGQTKVFHGSEWIRVDTTNDEEFDLPKLEAQAWLTLYNLMSKKESKDKYDLHHYR